MAKVLEKERKYSIDFYLRESKLTDNLKRMMRDLHQGQSRTLEEWKKIDEKINKRRA